MRVSRVVGRWEKTLLLVVCREVWEGRFVSFSFLSIIQLLLL